MFWCCLDSSEVLLWDVVYSCSSRRCVCVFMCTSVPSPVIPELGTVWAGGLSWTERRGVVVVKVDPWGWKSWLHLTSNLLPPPLAVTHTCTHTHTGLHKLKYCAHACMGRYHKCTNKTGHTHALKPHLFRPHLQVIAEKEKKECFSKLSQNKKHKNKKERSQRWRKKKRHYKDDFNSKREVENIGKNVSGRAHACMYEVSSLPLNSCSKVIMVTLFTAMYIVRICVNVVEPWGT